MQRKWKINKHTLVAVIVEIVLLLLYFIGYSSSGKGMNIQLISIIGILLIIYIVLSWRNTYFRILSPYIIIVSTMYLVLCGQSIVWAFGLKAGYRDLRYASYNSLSFSTNELILGLLFSYICIGMMHVAVINSVNPFTHKTRKKTTYDEKQRVTPKTVDKNLYTILVWFGMTIVVLTLIPYIYSSVKQYAMVVLSGYGIQYEKTTYGLESIGSKISELFPIGVITLLYAWGKKSIYNKNAFVIKIMFAYAMVAVYLLFQLRLYQRTGVLLFLIAILFIYYSDRVIPKRLIVWGLIIGIVLMASMRMIDMIRSGSITDFTDFMSYTLGENNPVLDFLGDIGWNLMTTVEFQRVIPYIKPYGLGFSYIISLTSIIPNLNFWPIHPAYVYGNIAGWLQDYLGFSFGIGCTPVAEAYYNFGSFGFLVFIIWGKFISYLNRKYDQSRSILDNYQVVLFMGLLLKSFVRSSFFAVFRPFIVYILVPTLLIRETYKLLSTRK